jgi:hypothetical protein
MPANNLAAVCFEIQEAPDLEIVTIARCVTVGAFGVWELV